MGSGEGSTMKNSIVCIVARMEEGRSAFKNLTGTPTGKRPLGRPRRRWVENVRMDLKEIVSIRGIVLIPLRKGISGAPL